MRGEFALTELIKGGVRKHRLRRAWEFSIALIVWLLIARAIYASYGWIGLGTAVLALAGIFAVAIGFDARDRMAQKRQSRLPCAHGIAGARVDADRCVPCAEGKRRAEAEAVAVAREKVEQAAAERARAHAEWLSQIRLPEFLTSMDPKDFELLVCELYRRMGHQVESTRFSGDGGIDGYLRKDGQLALLQCKRVKGSVGEPVLRDLFGTMVASEAAAGVVVTTGKVSAQARQWIQGKPIRIIELKELRELLEKHFAESDIVPADFSPSKEFVNVRCPRCHRPLRQVQINTGTMWRCSGYPGCRYMPPDSPSPKWSNS